VLGYQPKRGDFDQEYDMDAELLLADMEFHEDDTPENTKLKENVLELYNARLDERIRRKNFVIERGLLDLKNVQRTERKYSKEEREIVNKCKIFARFQTKEDHERFVNGLLKERLIREAIEQLQYFRSKGLTTLDQVEKYIETNKSKFKQMAYENKNFSSGKAHQKNLLNGQWSEDHLSQLQKTISKPEVAHLGGREMKTSSKMVSQSPLVADAKWSQLSNKEKAFVMDVNMKPTTYCTIKRQI
jgi:hypothetical protein